MGGLTPKAPPSPGGPSSSALPTKGPLTSKLPPGAKGVKSGGGGGWLGHLAHETGHIASNLGTGLVMDAIHTPAGFQKLIADSATSVKQQFEPMHMGQPSALTLDIRNMAKQTKLSVSDPHYMAEHPDQTLLNVFALATGGAGAAERIGLAGEAAKAGDLGGTLKALTTKPAPVTRLISHDGFSVELPAADNPLTRTVQKATGALREKFPDVPMVSTAVKAGKANARNVRIDQRINEVPISDMIGKSKEAGLLTRGKNVGKLGTLGKLTDDALARQQAIRVVAEGVPTDTRIATHERFIRDGKSSQAQHPEIRAMRDRTFMAGHNEQIKLNTLAQKYLDETGPTPKLTDPKMQEAYDAMKKVATNREQLLDRINSLDPEIAKGRLSKPGQLFTNDPKFAGGEMRIKTVPKYKGSKSTQIRYGASHGLGEVQTPGSLTHAYSGAAYAGGAIDTNVVKLMAESGLEAQKFWTLLHVADGLKGAAKDLPETKYDIPMVTQKLPGRPSLAEAQLRMEDDRTAPEQMASMSHGYEGVRQALFPSHGRDASGLATTPVSHFDEAGNPVPIPGIKFVDERLLGGLDKASPLLDLMEHPNFVRGVNTVDAINNASKIAILYLKPAYVAPNLLSNVAMNFVQQGFSAPANLARAAKLWKSADPETVRLVLAGAGEGKISVLDSSVGRASKAAHAAAGFWQKPVDVIPRLASFLYEARRDGITSDAELKQLFKNPAQADKLRQIALRANDSMIDFGNLSPIERNIISRTIFFYPWVKGSAKWLGRLPIEHPLVAGSSGVLGPLGQNKQASALGPNIPAWAEGNVPIGGNGPHGLPKSWDPFTVTPWVQSGDLIQSIMALATGHPGEAASSIPDMLSPALGSAVTALSGHPGKALKSLYAQLPPVVDTQQAMGKGSKTYPNEGTFWQALGRYLLGTGMIPRETDPGELEKSAYLSKHGHTITVPK